MCRLDRSREQITKSFQIGTPISTIAARHMTSLQALSKALERWELIPRPPSRIAQLEAENAALKAALADLQKEQPPMKATSRGQVPRTVKPKPAVGERGPTDKRIGVPRKMAERQPERNAKIRELHAKGLSHQEIAEQLGLASRMVSIGVVQRAGVSQTRAEKVQASRVRAYKKNRPKSLPTPEIDNEEAPKKRHPYTGWARRHPSAPKSAPERRLVTEEPGRTVVGELFEDTTGCTWPFDDRSPHPRREWLSYDYLRCNEPQMICVDAHGQKAKRCYCKHHWQRAHGSGKIRKSRRV